MDPAETDRSIDAAAAEWVIRRGGGPLAPEEQHAFARWHADPRHAAALERAEATWAELGALRQDPGSLIDDLVPAAPRRLRPPRSFPHAWAAALAASVVIAIGASTLWFGSPILILTADYRTAPGALDRIVLADGSVVELGPASAIDTEYDEKERRVRLLAGEAYFTVAPKQGTELRPFVVAAANGTSTALGTQFSVALQDDGAEVMVTEHRVGVSTEPHQGEEPMAVLTEGQAVRYDSVNGLGPVFAVNAAQATAWRRGRVVFDRVPLNEVVATLNRYRHGRILIADSALADRRVSGVFETDNLDNVLETITQELGVRSASLPPLVTVLY